MQLCFKSNYLDWLKQGTYFENATACSKRTLKTTVATQLSQAFCVVFFTERFTDLDKLNFLMVV